MRICDWRSGVCSSDLIMVDRMDGAARLRDGIYVLRMDDTLMVKRVALGLIKGKFSIRSDNPNYPVWEDIDPALVNVIGRVIRSEEHTSELQSLMRISYAVFCLTKKKKTHSY